MDTREELHAVLEELDSDKLPDPEALRGALQSLWLVTHDEMPHTPMLDSFDAELLRAVRFELRAGTTPNSTSWPRNTIVYAFRAPDEATSPADRLWFTVRRASSVEALPQGDPEQADEPIEQPSPGEASAENTPDVERKHKKPRKLPRSLGMGKGSADLSQREGFAPPEDGEAG